MKKYQFIGTFILVTAYLIYIYISLNAMYTERKTYLSDLDINIVNMESLLQVEKEHIKSNYQLWGLPKSKLLLKREEKVAQPILKNHLEEKNQDKIKIKKRVICLDKECWEFVGKITINHKKSVTLLSKNRKRKMEVFKEGDTILKNLMITKIDKNYMVVSNLKNGQRMMLKLFDINISAYYPKNRQQVKLKEVNE